MLASSDAGHHPVHDPWSSGTSVRGDILHTLHRPAEPGNLVAKLPRCGLRKALGVAQGLFHRPQAPATHHRRRGEPVSEIVDSHVIEPARLARPQPRLLQALEVRPLYDRSSGRKFTRRAQLPS